MSSPSQTIQAIYAALGSGDIPTLLEFVTDDVEWIFDGSIGDRYMRTAHGKDDLMKWFGEVAALDGIQAFEPRQMLTGDDHVTVIGWERTQALPDGGVFESSWVHVWQLRGGRVSRFFGMLDTAAVARARAMVRR